MKKKVFDIGKKFILLICFLAALFAVLHYVLSVLEWKDGYGLKTWDEFYSLPKNSADVLCFGSSHNMCTVNHGILWNEHGFTSASAGGIGLSLRTTYYFMRETLNYQKPKVILLETVYSVWDSEDYTSYEEVMALNHSKDRAALVKELYGDNENYMDYLLRLPVYHTRYWETSKKDFTGFGMYSLGYYGTWNIYSNGEPREFSKTEKAEAIDEEKFEWLQKIVALCKEKEIPLVFYISPYNAYVDQAEWNQLKWVEDYAEKQDIPMINFNRMYEELQIDFTHDYADNHHLNVYGGEKVTRYLGNYLSENYDLEDHRGQKGYDKWENCYKNYVHEENCFQLKWEQDLHRYLDKLSQDENFITMFSFCGEDYRKVLDEELIQKFQEIGISKKMLEEMKAGNILASNGTCFYKTGDTDTVYSYTKDGCDFWIRVDEDGKEELIVDKIPFAYHSNGIYTITYSKLTGKQVDRAFFSPYNGFVKTEEDEE